MCFGNYSLFQIVMAEQKREQSIDTPKLNSDKIR